MSFQRERPSAPSQMDSSEELGKSRVVPQFLQVPALVGPLGAAINQWWAQLSGETRCAQGPRLVVVRDARLTAVVTAMALFHPGPRPEGFGKPTGPSGTLICKSTGGAIAVKEDSVSKVSNV